jgi:hypothetical protein
MTAATSASQQDKTGWAWVNGVTEETAWEDLILTLGKSTHVSLGVVPAKTSPRPMRSWFEGSRGRGVEGDGIVGLLGAVVDVETSSVEWFLD